MEEKEREARHREWLMAREREEASKVWKSCNEGFSWDNADMDLF